MSTERLRTLLTFAIVACIAALFLVWPSRRPTGPQGHAAVSVQPTVNEAAAPAVTAQVAAVSNEALLGAEAKALLAALRKLLVRRDARAGETVLAFKDDAAMARFLERAGKTGLNVIGRLDALHSVRVHYDSLKSLQNELLQNPADYADISGNYIFNVPQVPAKESRAAIDQVPFGNDALAFIGATGDRSQWGRGITIAILDTGVAPDPTFGGRVTTLDVGFGITPGKGSEDGHGTSVASLAAGLAGDAPGVAPAANILSLRVTDANGTSDIFTISQAIVTAVDAGARIVNVSLGGYSTNATLNAAIAYAQTHGAVIVAAAGNDQAAQLAWPAADPRVVSVGAVDKAEQQVTFSNSGSQLYLTAPGYGVQTAWLEGQRAYVDGTSASAPIVSGALAAVLSQNPNLSAADAVALLTRTANDAGAPGADPAYGKGILNIGWALNASNPTYVDTAVSSHYYDPNTNLMSFVVQNRSGQTVAGMTLSVTAGTTTRDFLIPPLTAGQSDVVRVQVDSGQLALAGRINYATTLTNPLGVTDQVPRNNRRNSVLTAPK